MYYIIDTNIWIDVSRGKLACEDITGKAAVRVALAPPVIIELVRGVMKSKGERFEGDHRLFRCMTQPKPEILPLPRVFVSTLLWNLSDGR